MQKKTQLTTNSQESVETQGALTICMENPEILGRIQMEKVHPGGNFPEEKVIPFEVLPLPIFTEMTEIFCTICLDY